MTSATGPSQWLAVVKHARSLWPGGPFNQEGTRLWKLPGWPARSAPYVAAGGARVYAAVTDGVLVVDIRTGDGTVPIAIRVDDTPVGHMEPSHGAGRHRRAPA